MGSGVWAQLLYCTSLLDLPGPGIESLSPVLTEGFLTTGPPGKPHKSYILTVSDLLHYEHLEHHGEVVSMLCPSQRDVQSLEMLVTNDV